ncbi:MAG: hypothetical protein JWN56_1624 [Sphingobacteriales bacterium]|nr:hypothetical protein [Sphingobacteriales bacterium]
MRKYSVIILLLMVMSLAACTDKLRDRICTTEFRTITIRFKNVAGDYVTVQNFKAVVERTGVELNNSNNQLAMFYYAVASDSDIQKLSKEGDIINVTATNPSNGNPISATFKIGGGECHIEKVSGPEELTVN